MSLAVKHMKWWGWGHEDFELDVSDKPGLWPFICASLGLEATPPPQPLVSFEQIQLPAVRQNPGFLAEARRIVSAEQLQLDKRARLIHAYGKSFRDLWRIRRGIVERAPDCVVYPRSEAEVAKLVRAAVEHDVVLIPFGGGSNIAGCLEAQDPWGRMIVSLDMGRMNRVLKVDFHSQVATIEAGACGGALESQLAQHGVTLGHFPDSFWHSTLGGWIATRSAGMQSDKYGKIEDMLVALRMVTPSGTLVTRAVPRASNGIEINRLCAGSEGVLGIITQAVMQVHPLPQTRLSLGYLFPDFPSGVAAIHECVRRCRLPVMTRLNDPAKTALSLAARSRSTWAGRQAARALGWYLQRIRRCSFNTACLLLVGFEGSRREVARQNRDVAAVYSRHGGVCLGSGPGRAFQRAKYDFPHLRDLVMNHGIWADVSETATVWSNVLPLYQQVRRAVLDAIHCVQARGWVGCHISHNYHTGASLYFTFAWHGASGDTLEQYQTIKSAAEDVFIAGGASLSHHHAVGTEHQPWLEADISPTGVQALQALKAGLDPQQVMNPGKLVPATVRAAEPQPK